MKASGPPLSVALALGAALLAALTAAPAKAALGDKVASVQADRVSVKGQLRESRSEPGYTVQEITAATGTVIREYVAPGGTVFAVSWSGPAMPDLQQIFGAYFAQYQAAVQTQHAGTRRGGHHHVEVHAPSLVVHSGGHMRQYSGMAYVPSLVPQNLSISDLH